MAVPHSQLGLAWVQLQGSAIPCHEVILKHQPLLPPPLQLQTFCFAIRNDLRKAEFNRQFPGWSCSVVSKSRGKVAAAGSLQSVEMEGK